MITQLNSIKQIVTTCVLCFIAYFASAQNPQDVLMTVGNTPVTVEEFKYIYQKNNGATADFSEKSINEYLDLYTKFKLKVNKAKDMKMDTIGSLQEELAGYKRQLANSYLMDKEVLDYLLRQAFERQKEDVKIAHIFIPITKATSQEEKASAKVKMEEALSKLKSGMSFEEAVRQYSQDKNTNNSGGVLTYFTALMPDGFYELENAMYETKVGGFSNIVNTRIGLHIIKVLDKRAARGRMKIAHILIPKENGKAKDIANKAYEELVLGRDWEEVVANYSEDSKTKGNGGVLPELGINMFENDFEEAAFNLKENGAISKPVESKIGYHIIKRIEKLEDLDYSSFKKAYEPKIKKDSRYEEAKVQLIESIKSASKFQFDDKEFSRFTKGLNEEFLSFKWSPELSSQESNSTLMSFGGDKRYTVGDFAEYCKKNTRTRLKYDKTETSPSEVAEIIFADFINEKAIDYEQSNLEKKYADFRSLMREYEEGILLFEVTKNEVWDRANEDTVGLKKYYEQNKRQYMSEDRADLVMIFINTEDPKLAEKVAAYIQKKGVKKTKKKFNKKGEIVATFEEKLDKSNSQFTNMDWVAPSYSSLDYDAKAKRHVLKKIEKLYPPQVKELSEARGYIVADYQDYLEKEWIASLKKTYQVEVNKEVLNQLIKK